MGSAVVRGGFEKGSRMHGVFLRRAFRAQEARASTTQPFSPGAGGGQRLQRGHHRL